MTENVVFYLKCKQCSKERKHSIKQLFERKALKELLEGLLRLYFSELHYTNFFLYYEHLKCQYYATHFNDERNSKKIS